MTDFLTLTEFFTLLGLLSILSIIIFVFSQFEELIQWITKGVIIGTLKLVAGLLVISSIVGIFFFIIWAIKTVWYIV